MDVLSSGFQIGDIDGALPDLAQPAVEPAMGLCQSAYKLSWKEATGPTQRVNAITANS